MEYYLALKRHDLPSLGKTWRKFVWIITKWKKPIWKGYILYDSKYMNSGKGKTMEKIKRSVVARSWRRQGWISSAQRVYFFLGQWNYTLWYPYGIHVIKHVCVLSLFSRVPLFATLWTVAHQATLSMGFSRQEYWSGLPCPPAGDLLDLGIKPMSLASPVLAAEFIIPRTTWEALYICQNLQNIHHQEWTLI